MLRENLTKLQRQFEKNTSKEQKLLNDLQSVEKAYSALSTKQQQYQSSLVSLGGEKQTMKTKLEVLEIKNQQANHNLKDLVRASYMLGQHDSIRLVLSQEKPNQIARTLSMYRYLVQSRQQQISEIRSLKKDYKETSKAIEAQQSKIDQLLVELDKNKTDMQHTEASRKKQLNLVREALSDEQEQISVYQQREKELSQLLASLQRTRITETNNQLSDNQTPADGEYEETQVESGEQGISSDARNTNQNISPVLLGGFQQSKGKMRLPVKARIDKRFGQIKSESGLAWEGLMFSMQQGQQVSAIYPGQVVFSDWFRGYGQLLVLDHGEGYMSLYGHNQHLQVELGKSVDAGELIALSGDTGGLEKPGLYFEIRVEGAPDDPLRWCKH